MSQNLLNSLCQFWNDMSIPLQILHYTSLSWHITSLQILRSYLFYVGRKDPIKVPILTLSSALVKICQISQVLFQATSKFLFKIFISLHCHKRKLLCTFVAQAVYTLVTRCQLKQNFFSLSSARVKICEVPYVNFKTTSQFLFNFRIILHCHDTWLLCKF